jgi:hypothetical protein
MFGSIGNFDEAVALVDEIIEMEQPPPVQSCLVCCGAGVSIG